MQRSKAISDELNDLFEVIEQQAHEYAQAFKSIKMKIAELDDKKAEVDNFISYFDNQLRDIENRAKNNIEKNVSVLNNNLSKVLELHEQYSNIMINKEAVEKFCVDYKTQLDKIQIITEDLTKRYESQLSSILNELKYRAEKTAESLSGRIFDTFDAKYKRIDGNIFEIEKRMASSIDYNNRIFKELHDETAALGIKILNIKNEERIIPNNQDEIVALTNSVEAIPEKLDNLRKYFDDAIYRLDNELTDLAANENGIHDKVMANERENENLKILLNEKSAEIAQLKRNQIIAFTVFFVLLIIAILK